MTTQLQAPRSAPFALGFAQPRQAHPVAPFSYDRKQQVNVLTDGSRAADNLPLLMGTSTTTSTAGSATHNDDD
ncbi:putative ATP-grasp-modified RiPP [Streptomyces sp. RLB1-9]|uniref:putative ATP-grasp-modified RiPP n=1 Tax=Streptomyces sp. RLB1-9 TaxID=2594454 RepID=UPI001F07F74E|nr:putative ATP-grasp-modified RiPP [Streptomyces sp. RLB1-9]